MKCMLGGGGVLLSFCDETVIYGYFELLTLNAE